MAERNLDLKGVFATPAVDVERAPDGSPVLRSRHALGSYARCTGEYLEHWARVTPERPFLMERGPNNLWQGVTYGEALARVLRIGGWLAGKGFSTDRPVMILCENSVNHALLTLACLHVGIPVAPVSPAYSLVSRDFGKLKAIVALLRPGLIYVGDRRRFAPALEAVAGLHDASIVVAGEPGADAGTLSLETLMETGELAAAQQAAALVSPDTIAKFLFTSGSTDEPKAVINTQRMLCSNQEAVRTLWPFLEEPPILVDWLPWHHTFGGNHNFNLVLRNGGTLYIDRGRPVPGEFQKTLANLREVPPTILLNVPRGYDLLVSALRADPVLAARVFSRLKLIFYAAAALPQHLWESLRALTVQSLGHALPMVSSWGLTETAPAATSCHYVAERAGVVGLPIPGCEVKLVASGNRLEARVRGPNVTPGYWRLPEVTATCFDEQGFFRSGDAMRFADPAHPEQGLLFDGRLGENFKLSTATWVHVGALRVRAIAALAPVAQDVVVTGHDRDEIGFLIVPDVEACRHICNLSAHAGTAQILAHGAVRARVAAALFTLAESAGGSSTHATRALLLGDPLSIDAGEITDKGYVNQRAVLRRRAALVDRLYQVPLDASVITPSRGESAVTPVGTEY